MKKCLNCQRKYPDEQIYCNECGSILQAEIAQITVNDTAANKNVKSKTRKPKKTALIVSIVSTILACCFLGTSIYFYCEYRYYEKQYNQQLSQNQDLQELQEESEEYKTQYDNIETQNSALRIELEENKNRYTDIEAQNSDLRTELEDYKGRFDNIETQNQDLRKAMETYKNRYDYIVENIAPGTDEYYPEKYIITIPCGETYSLPIYCSILDTTISFEQSDGIACSWIEEWDNYTIHLQIEAITEGIHSILFTNDENSDQFTVIVIVD